MRESQKYKDPTGSRSTSLITCMLPTDACVLHGAIHPPGLSYSNLIVLCNCYVLLHPEGPVNVERVLVQGQHEDNEHKERVEHGEVEDGHVPQLFESLRCFRLL